MSEAGCTTEQLSATLDRLKACRASGKDYVAASAQVLAVMAKLGPIGSKSPLDLANLYQKLTQEFLYAKNVLSCTDTLMSGIRARKRQNIDFPGKFF